MPQCLLEPEAAVAGHAVAAEKTLGSKRVDEARHVLEGDPAHPIREGGGPPTEGDDGVWRHRVEALGQLLASIGDDLGRAPPKGGHRIGKLRGLGAPAGLSPIVPALDGPASSKRSVYDRAYHAVVVLALHDEDEAESPAHERRKASR